MSTFSLSSLLFQRCLPAASPFVSQTCALFLLRSAFIADEWSFFPARFLCTHSSSSSISSVFSVSLGLRFLMPLAQRGAAETSAFARILMHLVSDLCFSLRLSPYHYSPYYFSYYSASLAACHL